MMQATLVSPREAVDYDVTQVETDRGQARRVDCRHCGYNTQKWQRSKAVDTYETHWRVRHPELVKEREADADAAYDGVQRAPEQRAAPGGVLDCTRCDTGRVVVAEEGTCPVHGPVCIPCWDREAHSSCFVD